MNQEPTLNDMDDYNNKESSSKTKIIWLVVLLCLIVGTIISMFERGDSKREILQTVPKEDSGKK